MSMTCYQSDGGSSYRSVDDAEHGLDLPHDVVDGDSCFLESGGPPQAGVEQKQDTEADGGETWPPCHHGTAIICHHQSPQKTQSCRPGRGWM